MLCSLKLARAKNAFSISLAEMEKIEEIVAVLQVSSLSKEPRKKPFPALADEPQQTRIAMENIANDDANPIE
jgi:hypothetical protein